MGALSHLTPLFGALLPPNTSDLAAPDRARLLDLTFARHRFGISIMPVVAAPLVWFFAQTHDATLLALWATFFLIFAMSMRAFQARYARDARVMDASDLIRLWEPRVEWIALVHGFGLSMAVVLTAGHATYEFGLLLYVAIASITAANATHQNASLSIFLRFFVSGWVSCSMLSIWAFPQHWEYILPLCVLFGIANYRDALSAHRFFVEHVRLQAHSQLLISDLVMARQSAELALQEKDLFLTTASHDLRQPMHAISMLVAAMAHRNSDPSMTPLLADLRHGMQSMNQMFNALLDLSRLESGTLPTRASSVDLKALLIGLGTLFREQAHQRGLGLRVHVPRVAATVYADPMLLRQAISNLVHNALRYTPKGGVLLGLRRRGAYWSIEVWDTGVGIAAQDSAHIFSPYYRNQDAWRVDSAGHGLGLAVAARCARMLPAELDFQSRPGKGSRFWLRLAAQNRTEVHSSLKPQVSSPSNAPLQRLSGTCLVLDDDPQVIAAWTALLQAWDVDARFAMDGHEAMQHLDSGFVPDAIFCDQRLRSGESGLHILRALLERCPAASGAMVSGELQSADLIEAESEGYLVLRKPLDVEQLHAVLLTWSQLGRG